MGKELKWIVLAVIGGVIGGFAWEWCKERWGS